MLPIFALASAVLSDDDRTAIFDVAGLIINRLAVGYRSRRILASHSRMVLAANWAVSWVPPEC